MSYSGLLVFCWLVLMLGLGMLAWFLTRRHDAVFFSVRNVVRVGVRSLTLALVFAPTVFYYGVGYLPVPASLSLCWYVFFPENRDKALVINTRISLVCLLVAWFVFALVCGGNLAWKLAKDRRKKRSGN
jgi:hypothetical protein